jgi:glycosyltransferase involved in cell wall biosynthesis
MNYPFLSLILPCRNEELFISQCLESIISNKYPSDRMEILAIDGLSTDNTKLTLERFSKEFSFIHILTNDKKTFPTAVNLGIEASRGEIIIVLGAHAKYESDYLKKCVTYIYEYEADNVGGVIQTKPVINNIMGRLISAVLSSPFGVGNSKFRTGSDIVMEADTVFGGCYRKEVFLKFGKFNELLISSSDFEFNRRIQKGGAKILLFPDIHVTYFTRSTMTSFLENNIRNGFWAIYPIAVSDHFPVGIRHLVPLFFTLFLISAAFGSIFWVFPAYSLIGVLILYLLTSLVYSFKKNREVGHFFIILPIMFFCLHFTYGIGSIYGFIRYLMRIVFKRGNNVSCLY